MTQSLESNDYKFTKLLRLFLLKRWPGDADLSNLSINSTNPDKNSDTHSEASSDELLTKAIFSAAGDSYLDPLFLEYVCLLIQDHRAQVSIASVIELVRKDSSIASSDKHLLIICIAKTAPSCNVDDHLLKALINYIQQKDQCSGQELRALGFLLFKLGENLQQLSERPLYSSLKSSMSSYVNILADIDAPLRDKLRVLYHLDDKSEDTLENLPEKPPKNENGEPVELPIFSRAFRLIWLEKLLFSFNLIQGDSLLQEISVLFADNSPKVILESLITTSFDGLAASMLRGDDQRFVNLWGSFITKSLPVLVKHYVADIPEAYIESVVCRPISLLDRATIVQISGGGDTLDEMFSSFPPTTVDLRAHFLQACVDLKLISTESLKRTLGNEAVSLEPDSNQLDGQDSIYLPIPGGKSTEVISITDLFSTRIAKEYPDASAIDESILFNLINHQFGDIDGVRQAIISAKTLGLVKEWAANSINTSRSLGQLCLSWAQNSSALDMLFLHISPTDVLSPLVKCLDNWNEDEEETNFQDRYVDFGYIYLLVCLIYRRYEISLDHLPDWSFTKNQLQQLDIPVGSYFVKNFEDLSDRRKELLGGWISALFDGGGISDDLMRLSSIQQLMDLVPIILQQIISACDKKIVDMETLKGGLDYLRQPFLAFTLVVGFQYLCQSIWRATTATPAQLVVVQELLLPGERSAETLRIHDVVLSIVGDKFIYAFNTNIASAAALNIPANEVLTRSIQALQSKNINGQRARYLPESASSLAGILKEHIAVLVSWLLSIENGNASPPWYNIDTLTLAMPFLGWSKTTQVLLEELALSSSQGTFDTTLDVISTLIFLCAGRAYELVTESEDGKFTKKSVNSLEATRNASKTKPEVTTDQKLALSFQKLESTLLALNARFSESKLMVGKRWLNYAVSTEPEPEPPTSKSPENFLDKQFSYDDDMLNPNSIDGLDMDMGDLFDADMNM